MLNPREFLDQFVLPCVKCWERDPLNVRKAVIAISQIDILADQVIIHQHPDYNRDQVTNLRKAAEQNSPIRLLVRDVHDTHTSMAPLQRATATITTSERPMQNYAFQVGTPVLEIVQDDGTKHLVENVITDALTYWEGELSSLRL